MFAFIVGQLEDPGPPTVLNCRGVGYEIWVPERNRMRLGALGDLVRLYTHLAVREDAMTLYGFPSPREREMFRGLVSVSGVGPKVALAILGDESAPTILGSIRTGDATQLTRVKGIGRKTAERLIVELKDMAQGWGEAPREAAAVAGAGERQELYDARLALVGMGLSDDRARIAIDAVEPAARERASVEDLVRLALRKAVT